ncbi:IclR family transcriptional regulator C-terminal domain-containing protein [Streptomyces sviceus]|uniref:IclR family transcriptional regulator domain-containing protein n=1 Tax=Streptomyces sviceus TaxID=285530 RepID=UPI0036C3AE75
MQHTQPFSASTAPVADRAEGDRPVGSDRVPAVLRGLVRRTDGVALDEPTRAIGGPEPIVRGARPAGQDCQEHMGVRPVPQTPAVRRWVGGVPLERPTPRTRCTAEELHRELRDRRARGYALDDQENEPGVNCPAPLYGTSPTALSGAVSVSGPADRIRSVEGTLLKEPPR